MIATKSYNANIYVGLKPGYDGEVQPVEKAIELAQTYVDKVGLCVTVTPTNFVYKNGREPGVIVGLINYPRFPSEPSEIIDHAIALGDILKEGLEQYRVSVVLPELTTMIGE
jgi:hypothetical protein